MRQQPNLRHAPLVLLALLLAPLAVGAPGCTATPEPSPSQGEDASQPAQPPPEPPLPGRAGEFSADLAWGHLTALVELGPRPTGSPGNEAARRYLVDQLEALGLEVRAWDATIGLPSTGGDESAPPPRITRQLSVVIPGSQPKGAIALAAPYDSREVLDAALRGANEGASGAAVLLEIARVLVADPLPYATELFFLDGENGFIAAPGRLLSNVGTGIVIAHLDDRPDVHLLVYLDRVGDTDLRIAPNAMSHRVYRGDIWKAAARIGKSAAFPNDAVLHLGGARERQVATGRILRVVWIRDESYGGDVPPGLHQDVEEDLQHCSPDSLETIGTVLLTALDAINRRLVKIDRFTSSSTHAAPPGADPRVTEPVASSEEGE
jgi:hypothetical protein